MKSGDREAKVACVLSSVVKSLQFMNPGRGKCKCLAFWEFHYANIDLGLDWSRNLPFLIGLV